MASFELCRKKAAKEPKLGTKSEDKEALANIKDISNSLAKKVPSLPKALVSTILKLQINKKPDLTKNKSLSHEARIQEVEDSYNFFCHLDELYKEFNLDTKQVEIADRLAYSDSSICDAKTDKQIEKLKKSKYPEKDEKEKDSIPIKVLKSYTTENPFVRMAGDFAIHKYEHLSSEKIEPPELQSKVNDLIKKTFKHVDFMVGLRKLFKEQDLNADAKKKVFFYAYHKNFSGKMLKIGKSIFSAAKFVGDPMLIPRMCWQTFNSIVTGKEKIKLSKGIFTIPDQVINIAKKITEKQLRAKMEKAFGK